MAKFEVIPGNPSLQAKYEIEKLALKIDCELNVIEESDEKIRFQLLSGDAGIVEDESKHKEFLKLLLERSEVMTNENSKVINNFGAINIVVDL